MAIVCGFCRSDRLKKLLFVVLIVGIDGDGSAEVQRC